MTRQGKPERTKETIMSEKKQDTHQGQRIGPALKNGST